ncbi:unnamed protein product [Adineta steineri]|uniref:Uncharacterized protein n=1 Tax=Adineta steineri TaxID=433720 RepID=A0A813NRJ9_9BILA|nr:unnamed protein product [Adineta steineri]CAF3893821.1 unnamed protein product [Adineta steineri]
MQVPFSKNHKQLVLPTMGYAVPTKDHQGPRITKAPITVANHIKAYYWFCLILVGVLVMGALGGIALALGVASSTQCLASDNLGVWLFAFGIVDIIFFICILIIVSALIKF